MNCLVQGYNLAMEIYHCIHIKEEKLLSSMKHPYYFDGIFLVNVLPSSFTCNILHVHVAPPGYIYCSYIIFILQIALESISEGPNF